MVDGVFKRQEKSRRKAPYFFYAKIFYRSKQIPFQQLSKIPAIAFLQVHFVDVGQGDGIWIHTFDDGIANGRFEGKNIVIDGGPDAADDENLLRRYIENQGHHNAIIDALIVSHPHDDHYPGADGILRHFDVRAYYDPGFPKMGVSYPAFLASVPMAIRGSH